MSGFSTEWLSWREPVDHAARSDEVLGALAQFFARTKDLAITDIGCGTGSTIRALKPVLPHKISWHLLDHDDALLAYASEILEDDAVRFELVELSNSIDPVFSDSPDLITTSAFLDLVSKSWLENLVSNIAQHQIPFYAALTYDGRSGCSPPHEADQSILECFNRHQLGDKGFGPALGPNAADITVRLFENNGYEVFWEKSDWKADRNHFEFQEALIYGWHQAACEIAPENRKVFEEWLAFRREQIGQENHSVYVGHIDFFAVPKV